jgi:hypothetical protein
MLTRALPLTFDILWSVPAPDVKRSSILPSPHPFAAVVNAFFPQQAIDLTLYILRPFAVRDLALDCQLCNSMVWGGAVLRQHVDTRT